MKSARLYTTAPSTGKRMPAPEIILQVTQEEAKLLIDALDLYCTENPHSQLGKKLFHTLGWNPEYFPQ